MSVLRSGVISIVLILFLYNTVTYSSKGFLNVKGFRDSLFNWTYGLANTCAANSARLLTLLNVVCSTAQAANTTARDGCYGCFIRYASLPQGINQLASLSACATMYFTGTPYAACSARLATTVSNTGGFVPINGQCINGYCEFVRCLRRINANNVIVACAREVRALSPVNVSIDADNVRYFSNITSCVLAKARCNTYNPITGEPQLPGILVINGLKTQSQVSLYNTLQIAPDGTLRVVVFPSTTAVSSTYCSSDAVLTQANWLSNECP